MSRVLGPFQLGRVSFADSATQYFIICAALGIPIYGIREIAKVKNDKQQLSTTFSELLLIQVITTVILFVLYFVLITFTSRFHAENTLFHLGLLQLTLSAFVTDWFFQGMENYVFVSIRAFIIRFISILLILLLVKQNSDVYLYYAIWTGSIVVNALMSAPLYFKYISLKHLNLKRHFKPVFTFFSTRVVTSVYVILLSFFVGYLENKSYVAYYTSAYKICTVSLSFILAFSTVLIPKLSEYYHNNKLDEITKLLSKSFNVMINYSLPLVFVLMFFSSALVRILLGKQFAPSSPDLILLSPLILVISISNIFSMNVLTPTGKENQYLKATFVGMMVSLLLVFILIPALKDVGAAIALLITECVVCIFAGYYSRHDIRGVNINYRVAVLNVANCIISFGAGKYILGLIINFSSMYIQFIVQIAVCGILYLLIELFLLKNPFLLESYYMIKNKMPGAKEKPVLSER